MSLVLVLKQLFSILFVPLAGGLVVCRGLYFNPVHRICCAYFAGLSMMMVSAALSQWFFQSLQVSLILGIYLMILIAGWIFCRKQKIAFTEDTSGRKTLLLFLILLPVSFYLVFRACLYPMFSYDGVHNYAYRAKIMTHYQNFNAHILQNHTNIATRSIPGQVPGVPFLLYLQNSLTGFGYFDNKLLFPLVYIFSCLIFFRNDDSVKMILFSFFMLFSFLHPLFFSTVSYGDIFTSIMYFQIMVLSFGLLSGKNINIFLIGIMASGFVLIKSESVVYLLIILLASIVVKRRNRSGWISLIAVLLMSILLVSLYKYSLYGEMNRDNFNDYFKHFSLSGILEKFRELLRVIFISGSFLYLIPLFVILKSSTAENRFIKVTLLLSFGTIMTVFLSMDNRSYLERVFMHYFFSIMYFLQSEFRMRMKTDESMAGPEVLPPVRAPVVSD